MRPLDWLRRYPVLNLLEPHQLATWLTVGQELPFAMGETIFQEGSPGVWVYLVLEGRVRILRRSSSGREIMLGHLGIGELFGEYALLPPHHNTASCRAATGVRLLRLPLLPLQPLLAALPEVGPRLKNWLRLHGLLSYLRGQPFLGFMSAPSALKYLDQLQRMQFLALRTIQADGLTADCWFYVEQGSIALHAPTDATATPPRELGPGDCFGERALLGQSGLPIAVALTDAHCLCLSRAAFAPPAGQNANVSLQSLHPQANTLLKSYVWVGQREEADCGVAALTMIARYHGANVSLERLRGQIIMGEQGASLIQLQHLGMALGLRCLAVRVEVEQLNHVVPPAIAHLCGGHYVVLYDVARDGVVVGDPATGIVRHSRVAFSQSCSGNMLLVQPREDRKKPEH